MGLKVQTQQAAKPEPGAVELDVLHGIGVDDPLSWNRPIPALCVARTIYIDSVNGNDANNGLSATAAFQSYSRALKDIFQFGEIRERYTFQFLGAGPYQVVHTSGLKCTGPNPGATTGGFVVWRGDATARTVHTSGTVTGDFTGPTINTSAGLGVDTQVGRFIEFTSGNLNGMIAAICTNTDTSITIVNGDSRANMGAAVNGDTFRIITPGTVLNAATAGNTFHDCTGQPADASGGPPRFIFFDLQLTNVSTFGFENMTVALPFVVLAASTFLIATSAQLQGHLPAAGAQLGLGFTAQQALAGCGMVSLATSTLSLLNSDWSGPIVSRGTVSLSGQQGGGGLMMVSGGRFNVLNIQIHGKWFWVSFSARHALRFDGLVSVDDNAVFSIGRQGGGAAAGYFVVAVSNTNWVTLRRGSLMLWYATTGSGGVNASGGITGGTGYAVDVRGGGRCYVIGFTPAVTGAVAGNDLRTTDTAIVANAALAAVPSSADAAANRWGEVLARVA